MLNILLKRNKNIMKKVLMIMIDIIIIFSGYIIFGKISSWFVSTFFTIFNIEGSARLMPLFMCFMIFGFFMIILIRIVIKINEIIKNPKK